MMGVELEQPQPQSERRGELINDDENAPTDAWRRTLEMNAEKRRN